MSTVLCWILKVERPSDEEWLSFRLVWIYVSTSLKHFWGLVIIESKVGYNSVLLKVN